MTRFTQYYPRWLALPHKGDIREVRSDGKNVSHMARVIHVDKKARRAILEQLDLDRNGKERLHNV